jgi:hypothetical protein
MGGNHAGTTKRKKLKNTKRIAAGKAKAAAKASK